MGEQLAIRTLGSVSILRNGAPVTGLDTRKVAALLIYLACNPRPHPREVLAEFLWEDREQSQSLSNLRVALANLRRHVGTFLHITRETIGIDPESDIWLDAEILRHQLKSDASSSSAALEASLALYRGPFLQGFTVDSVAFEEWVRQEREILGLLAVAALEGLIRQYIDQSDYVRGVLHAKRLIELDPYYETAHRYLITLHACAGHRDRALAQYEVCRAALRELGAEPEDETTILLRQIQRGNFRRRPLEPGPLPRGQEALLIESEPDLPARAEILVGRDNLLQTATGILEEGNKLVLQGFSGIGKTVLAAQIAARWIGAARGPVVWLPVVTEDVDSLLEALARVLDGAQVIAGRTGEVRHQAMRRLLTKKGVSLAIVDDAWNGRVLLQLLKSFPRSLPVLITSRHRIPVGRILDVSPLNIEHSLVLLSHHAGSALTAVNEDAVDLCNLLGCHPYALEIAGKTLLADRLAPAALMRRIGSAPHQLTMPALAADEGRESVGALLDVSIRALEPQTRDAFMAVGALYTGSASPRLLGFILNTGDAKTEELLSELARRGLVKAEFSPRAGRTIFRMHDLACSYARAMQSRNSQALMAACSHYAAAVAGDLTALDVEIGNLIGAALELRQSDQADALVALLGVLAIDSNYFEARGYTSRVIGLIEDAAQMARSSGDLRAAHYLLAKVGNAYSIHLGQFEPALDAYERGLALAYELDDPSRQAILLGLIGTTRFRANGGDPTPYYDEAYAMAKEHDAVDGLAFVLAHLSFHAAVSDPMDLDSFYRYSGEAIELAQRVGYFETWFHTLMNRAGVERSCGKTGAALATDHEALALAQEQKNYVWEAHALCGIGEDYDAMGHSAQAQDYLQQALLRYHEHGVEDHVRRLRQWMDTKRYEVPEFGNIGGGQRP